MNELCDSREVSFLCGLLSGNGHYSDFMKSGQEKKLAEAGAGLPAWERWLLNLAVRGVSRLRDKDTLADLFLTESDKIIIRVESMEAEDMEKQVMVARQRAMEDSSRNWSAVMTLDHLNQVNKRLIEVVKALAVSDVEPSVELPEIKVEDVKPAEGLRGGEEMVDTFAFLNQDVLEQIRKLGALKSDRVHEHPWFGELNGHQWFCLMVLHMQVHRKQIEAIIKGIKGATA